MAARTNGLEAPGGRTQGPRAELSSTALSLQAPLRRLGLPRRSLRAARGEIPEGAPAAGAEALAGRAADSAAAMEAFAQAYDADGPMLDRALAIVRTFIVERERIVFGGLAIDFALRLRGARLYPDGKRPDYDFFSPDSVGDAYELADRLAWAGFPEVKAICGIHVQTMRVFVDFVGVADIGYVPPAVFARIPALDAAGVRIVHPDYQRVDQHLAFCFPFNGAPREDVFSRWPKDLARWNLLSAHYPIAAESAEPARSTPKKVRGETALDAAGEGAALKVALHGFAAYAVLRQALDDVAAAVGVPAVTSAPRLALTWVDARRFDIEVPAGATATVATPFPDAAVGDSEATWRAPYMDAQPVTARVGDTVIFSTQNRQLGVSVIRSGPGPGDQCLIVTPQYLLVWLLSQSHQTEDVAERAVYRAYYLHVLNILAAAETVYSELARGDADSAARASWVTSPFVPSVRVLGPINQNESYQVSMAKSAGVLREPLPAALHVPAELVALVERTPPSYYPRPGSSRARPTFEYAGNPLFNRDGGVIRRG